MELKDHRNELNDELEEKQLFKYIQISINNLIELVQIVFFFKV